jgi:hypothetical protein
MNNKVFRHFHQQTEYATCKLCFHCLPPDGTTEHSKKEKNLCEIWHKLLLFDCLFTFRTFKICTFLRVNKSYRTLHFLKMCENLCEVNHHVNAHLWI